MFGRRLEMPRGAYLMGPYSLQVWFWNPSSLKKGVEKWYNLYIVSSIMLIF